jgi:hypothetical protein
MPALCITTRGRYHESPKSPVVAGEDFPNGGNSFATWAVNRKEKHTISRLKVWAEEHRWVASAEKNFKFHDPIAFQGDEETTNLVQVLAMTASEYGQRYRDMTIDPRRPELSHRRSRGE